MPMLKKRRIKRMSTAQLVPDCTYHPGRPSIASVANKEKNQVLFHVCTECKEKLIKKS